MLTRDLYTALGDLYRAGAPGTSIPASRGGLKAGLRRFLLDYAGGVCAFCGQDDEPVNEVLHVYPQGRTRLMWVPGGVGAGCRPCNVLDGDSPVPLESIMRPDLIPHAWPDRQALCSIGEAEQARQASVVEGRRAIRY